MRIRCAGCSRVVTLVDSAAMPERCPHCAERPVPERLGDFILERPLAAGGMGEVYLAHHIDLGTRVAIKLMPPPLAEDVSVLRERFAREARLQASVDHPGVVAVLECDVFGDRPYLVLEYVIGVSLRELLDAGPVPVAEVVRLCAETADVLAAAHARGVLHRDIKPENVLRSEDGRVRVLDFGIARARDGDAPVTRTGEIVGTPQYMAPEQLLDAGDEVDERCDVHALGVLAYELLTGSNPFPGANVFAVMKLVESLVPLPPSVERPEVPAAIDEVVKKALAKDRAQRWPTAAVFAAALRASIETDTKPRPRRWLLIGASMLVAVVIGITAGSSWNGELREQPAVERGGNRSGGPSPLATGRARLQRGEFHQAIADFELVGTVEARSLGQLAWLCAYRVMPLAVSAPDYWSACDEMRRARLFATDQESDEGTLGETVARLLSEGKAVAAWRQLQTDNRPTEALSTLALIAAHMACQDRRVLRSVSARLVDANTDVRALLDLRMMPRADRAERLQDLARRLPSDGPDHWLLQLLAASIDPGQNPGRLGTPAKMAWLHGGGEAAAVWFVGGRMRHARVSTPLSSSQVARLQTLLSGSDDTDAPAAAMQRQMLSAKLDMSGDPCQLPTFLFDAPDHAKAMLVAAGVDLNSFEAMALMLRVGAEPDATQEPWSRLAEGAMRERWLKEVCGGVQ